MSADQVTDSLWLWWLVNPSRPRLVGTQRHERRSAQHPGGVSLEYAPAWLASGLALSEDILLRAGEFLPAGADAAAGAVSDAAHPLGRADTGAGRTPYRLDLSTHLKSS